MKRVIALLLTLVMLLGLVPTALAAEGTVVKAEEVSGTPRLDAMAENDSAAETTQPTGHQPDDMVTILVELERAPVLEGFAAKKTASTSSAGAEIAAYLVARRNRMPPFAGIRKRFLPRSRRPSPPLSRRRAPALPVPLS